MEKLEQGRKDHGNKELRDDQGPSKLTRGSTQKFEAMKHKDLDKLRASTVKINILVD